MKSTRSKYRTRTLDDTLTTLFSADQRIIDLSVTSHPVAQSTKVAVLASSATGRKVLFSNYRQNSSSKRKRLPSALKCKPSSQNTQFPIPYTQSRITQQNQEFETCKTTATVQTA
jgi:hypothetical protein